MIVSGAGRAGKEIFPCLVHQSVCEESKSHEKQKDSIIDSEKNPLCLSTPKPCPDNADLDIQKMKRFDDGFGSL